MRRLTGICAALAIALVACQGTPPAVRTQPAAKSAAPIATSAVSASATSAPTPGSSVASAGVAVASLVDKLKKPTTPSVTLNGIVQIDASYIVATGGGNVLSHNGSAIVAAGGGNFVSHNGSSAITAADENLVVGGQIVAAGGGNVIGHNGSAFVSQNGSSIVSHNGSAVLSHNGSAMTAGNGQSTIVAQGGGNFVSHTYRLAQAKPTAYQQVPAAGMALQVISLDTRRPLPLGVDGAGNAVYTIYTNADGGYEVYIPASEQGNVVVEATNPVQADLRTTLDLVTPPDAGVDHPVNEATAALTRYIVQSFAFRMQDIMARPLEDSLRTVGVWSLDGPLKCLTATEIKELHAFGVAHGLGGGAITAAEQARVFQATLAALSLLKFDDITVAGSNERVLDALGRLTKKYTDIVTAGLAGDPDFIRKKAFFKQAIACDPQRYDIREPADIFDFMVQEYLGVMDHNSFDNVEAMLGSLYDPAATPDYATQANTDRGVISDSSIALIGAMFAAAGTDGTSAFYQELAKVLDGPIPSVDPGASPLPTPCWAGVSPSPGSAGAPDFTDCQPSASPS